MSIISSRFGFEKRDELRAYLKEHGVGTEVYYPLPLHLQNCYRDLGYVKGTFPQSERAAEEVLSIPIYAELTDEQLQYVVQYHCGVLSQTLTG